MLYNQSKGLWIYFYYFYIVYLNTSNQFADTFSTLSSQTKLKATKYHKRRFKFKKVLINYFWQGWSPTCCTIAARLGPGHRLLHFLADFCGWTWCSCCPGPYLQVLVAFLLLTLPRLRSMTLEQYSHNM